MDGLRCTGAETRLEACPFGGWGVENCVHAEDVALRCNASGLDTTGPLADVTEAGAALRGWAEAPRGDTDACTLAGQWARDEGEPSCGRCLVVLCFAALAGAVLVASSQWLLRAVQRSEDELTPLAPISERQEQELL